jgi:hypothetical protein
MVVAQHDLVVLHQMTSKAPGHAGSLMQVRPASRRSCLGLTHVLGALEEVAWAGQLQRRRVVFGETSGARRIDGVKRSRTMSGQLLSGS